MIHRIFVGSNWGKRDTRYTDEQWAKWISAVAAGEGVATLDMGPNWNPQTWPIGTFSENQIKQVKAIKAAIYGGK